MVRAAALTPAVLILLAGAPAFADAPDTWTDPGPVPALHVFLVLVAIPLGLIALITFLVMIPSMVHGERHRATLVTGSGSVWFGGPSGGVASLPEADESGSSDEASGDRGGASGRW